MASTPITREGKEKLQEELATMERRVPEVRKQIAEAREKGDLKENAEYHAAREELGMLHARISELKGRLAGCVVLNAGDVDQSKIAFGATVVLEDLTDGSEEEWHLVGPGEDDPLENRILVTSPMGQGLLGHASGDEVEVAAPAGTFRFRVLSFRYGG